MVAKPVCALLSCVFVILPGCQTATYNHDMYKCTSRNPRRYLAVFSHWSAKKREPPEDAR